MIVHMLDTQQYSYYLDIMTPRFIRPAKDDVLHTLTGVHQYRPDLLAFDLYKNSNLWWVFQARNPNAFEDPSLGLPCWCKILHS
jgi:hypothetical protein